MHFLRRIKRVLDKILGTKSDEWSWKFRHFFDKEWSKSYISEDTINHPHREMLVGAISKFYPFESVLELGSASGANLYLLAQKFPEVNFYGIDVSSPAVKEGIKFFNEKNIKNIFLQNISVNHLEGFKDKSMDVIFSDAMIIYIGQEKINMVFAEMARIAKKAIILCEQHTDGSSFYNDKWVHNYKKIASKIIPQAKISFIKIPENIWAGDWGQYGYIIAIKF